MVERKILGPSMDFQHLKGVDSVWKWWSLTTQMPTEIDIIWHPVSIRPGIWRGRHPGDALVMRLSAPPDVQLECRKNGVSTLGLAIPRERYRSYRATS
jgi:hypothetical protein